MSLLDRMRKSLTLKCYLRSESLLFGPDLEKVVIAVDA
jgi:hypothetical protein